MTAAAAAVAMLPTIQNEYHSRIVFKNE